MSTGKFATVITCMDGRVQRPVSRWMRRQLHVDYVDTITEAGPDRVLTEGWPSAIDAIRKKVEISVNGHGSRLVAVVSHHDCAGNPVPMEKHLEQNARCTRLVASWRLPVRILGLWVNEQWEVEVFEDIKAAVV